MTYSMAEEIYWTALHKIWENMQNSSRILRTLQQSITGEQLWKASALQLSDMSSLLPTAYVQSLVEQRRRYDLSKIEAYLHQHQIHVMLFQNPDYPPLLKEIHQPPALFYWKGNLNIAPLQIAMVGSRKADRYGLDVAEQLASQFSQYQIPVVSGLAKGIDAAAHKGAILHEGGTIAVQGCGIDRVYPNENKALAEAILAHERGCIISEFPIGSEPIAWHFPMRNRIISGLSQGVVIVQATRKSGAYITVETALEQGRDVFAVPGQINNPLSEGPHQLLQEGAQLVTKAEDVLAAYGLLQTKKQTTKQTEQQTEKQINSKTKNKTKHKQENNTKPAEQQMTLFVNPSASSQIDLSPEEAMVLNLFTAEPLTIEETAYLSKLSMAELMPILSMLELYGLIEPMVGRKYIRIG